MRDQMATKPTGIRTYVESMKRLMRYACQYGLSTLTIEPMSCLAEPPALPSEIVDLAEELLGYHDEFPNETAKVGYCSDISHGYADENREVKHSNLALLDAALPYVTELHLKNTDQFFDRLLALRRRKERVGLSR